jgi:hypothetical protein
MTPETPATTPWREYAWLLLRATLVACGLLVAYYAAIPGAKFFYQGF